MLPQVNTQNEHTTMHTDNHTYEVTDGEHRNENEIPKYINGVSRLVNGGCPKSSGSDITHPNGTECKALIMIKVAVFQDIHSSLNLLLFTNLGTPLNT